MKTVLFLASALGLSLGLSQAQEPVSISGRSLPTPDSRRVLLVETDERNPFGRIEVRSPTADLGFPQADTEESKLRGTVLNMPIRGVSISDSRSSVVLGNLPLSVGDELPPIFPGQMERLIVKEITPEKITFGFLERDGTSELRAFSKNFSVAPRVRYALPLDVMDADWGRRPYPLRGTISAEGHESAQ